MAATACSVSALLALLISLATGQTSHRPPHGPLRFVAQLSVGGCPMFVHDTGGLDGPHLAVEPLMCVKEGPSSWLTPRYDSVTEQTFVSVPVTLRDDAMLEDARLKLRHLSPKSVTFAKVSDVRAWTEASAVIRPLAFVWNPDDAVGFLRLGCEAESDECWTRFSMISKFGDYDRKNWIGWAGLSKLLPTCTVVNSNEFAVPFTMSSVRLTARFEMTGIMTELSYHLVMQNDSLVDSELSSARYIWPPACSQLRFVRQIRLPHCTARVHQRLDRKGHFLVEPLLCHNISSLSMDSLMYDVTRDMHYLKLDIALQDSTTLDAVSSHLPDLSPGSVAFMQVWRARINVSSVLSRRFEIGPLAVSADGSSAVMHVYCKSEVACSRLRWSLSTEPVNFWIHIGVQLTSISPQNCAVESAQMVRFSRLAEISKTSFWTGPEKCRMLQNGSVSVKIMQRVRGHVSFARTWTEYEQGFGDETDFWAGLKLISSLINSTRVTLRFEMKSWSGTEVFVEYVGFTVGSAETNYLMRYTYMGNRSPAVSYNEVDNDSAFSTVDRDNSRDRRNCSGAHSGNGGFWFGGCGRAFPTGAYPAPNEKKVGNMGWYLSSGSGFTYLREIRMFLKL